MVFNLVKRHFAKNKLAMTLLLLCQFASLLVVIFIFSLNIAKENYNKAFHEDRHAITLFCETLDTQLLASIFADGNYENISLFVADENGTTVRQNFRSREIPPLYLSIGRYFIEEEISNREAVAVIQDGVLINGKSLKRGDTVTLWEKEYDIIGSLGVMQSQVEIPLLDGFYEEAIVKFFLPESIPLSDFPQYAEQLKMRLSAREAAYSTEQVIDSTDVYSSIMSLPILIIANVNFVALYLYILMREREIVSIFRMCGCSERRCNFLLLKEFLLLSLLPFVIASIIYHYALNWILPYMNENVVYSMGLSDYGFVLLMYLVGLLLVFAPVIWHYNRKSPVALHRHI